MENPLRYFAELRGPRVKRKGEHLLEEILLISIAAVLSGTERRNDIAEYGEDKLEWLRTFLTLLSGIPSHDTFNRVLAALDPEEMETGFVAWVLSIAKLTAGEVIAIDGKALCGTPESGKKRLVHIVSARAECNGLVLAQHKVDEKSNEITAIPKLLNALELTGAVVNIDAIGCQRGIARQIIEKRPITYWRSTRIRACWASRLETHSFCWTQTRWPKESTVATDGASFASAR